MSEQTEGLGEVGATQDAGQNTEQTAQVPVTETGAVAPEVTAPAGASQEPTKVDTHVEYSFPEELYFNDQQVEIEVPDDLAASVQDAGADINAIVTELFAKGSDFSLSEETRKPLDDKYGKGVVTQFISALKAQNEYNLHQHTTSQAEEQAAQEERAAWSNELVGGEDKWEQMSAWAGDTLDDADLDNFDAAMQSGNKYIQELAIKELQGRFREAVGDKDYALIPADSGAASTGTGGALSSADYIKAISQIGNVPKEERAAAMQALDQRRRMGISAGM